MAGKLERIVKEIFQNNVIWSLIAVFMNAAINFAIVPFITGHIGVDAYGFVSLGNTMISYIDVISLALNTFASRYIAMYYLRRDMKEAKAYYSSLTMANIGLCVIMLALSVPFIFCLDHLIRIPEALTGDVKALFFFLLLRYFAVMMRTTLEVSAFIRNRLDLTSKIRVLSLLVQAAALVLLYGLLRPMIWYTGFSFFLAALFVLIGEYLLKKKLTPKLVMRREEFSFGIVKTLMRLGVWHSLTYAGNVLNTGLDLFITNRMLSGTDMGYVSVAKTLGSMCIATHTAVREAMKPLQLKAYSEDDIPQTVEQLKKSMRYSSFVSVLILAGFVAVGRHFLQLWTPGEDITVLYRLSVIVLLGESVVASVSPLYYTYILAKKVVLPCVLTFITGFGNVLSMYLLIHYTGMGVYAVVLTTLVVDLLHYLDAPLYAAYCLKVKWTTFYPAVGQHVLASLCMSVTMALIGCVLPGTGGWGALIVKCLVLGAVGAAEYFLIFDRRDLASLKERFTGRP